MKYSFCVTTNRGLEDIVAREISVLVPDAEKLEIGKSRVYFEANKEAVYLLNLWSRTIHRLLMVLGRERCKSLEDIYCFVSSLDFTGIIDRKQTFAVRAERSGKHKFSSPEIAATVGQAIIDSYLRDTGASLRVNLKFPDVEFMCYLVNDDFMITVNTTGESLHKRNYRVYNHPAALKATIASSLIMLSEWKTEEPFLDPMCGGGTIAIEAALIARNIAPGLFRKASFFFERLLPFDRDEYLKVRDEAERRANHGVYSITAIDISPRHLKGAHLNALSAGVHDTIRFIKGDARFLEKYMDIQPRVVVVNPPYGIKLTRMKHVPILYRDFLKSLKKVTERACLVVITAATRVFREACKEAEISIVERRLILHGALQTTVFKCVIG